MLDDFNKSKSSRRDFANMPVGRRHSYIKLEQRSVHSQPATAPLAKKKGRAKPRLAVYKLTHSRLFAWPRRLSRLLAQKTRQLYRSSGLIRLTALYKRTRAGKFLRRFRLEYPLVLLILLSIFIPLWQSRQQAGAYQLTAAEKSLVGNVNQSLSHRIDYDSSSKMYRFNHSAVKASAGDKQNIINDLQTRVSSSDQKDAPLYAASMPLDISKGVSYYDTNLQQSFNLIPQFGAQAGKLVDGRLLYPLGGDSTAVYSVKNNGLKEDILLTRASSDVMTFSYQLKLPDTLEAKMMPDGQNVGIYSADPSLYGDKAYGSKAAQAEAAQQRVNGPKNHLVFGLPAPVIKQTGSGSTKPAAKFILKGDSLTVFVTGLKSASYPLTIDPSVVVTSTSDFGTGNDESDIDFPANQINRGGLTGGTLNASSAAWGSTTSLGTATNQATSVAYNGYMYLIGGYTTAATANVYYAVINSNGSLGSWNPTATLPAATYQASAVVYNGFIYQIGGYTTGKVATVTYAAINADGSLGAWYTGSSYNLPTATYLATSVVYNGYLYEIGGHTTTSVSTVYYASINPNGTLGAWNTTTSLSSPTDTATSVVNNGYIYEIGGNNNSGIHQSTVYYAPINANGTIGSWTATTSLSAATYESTSVVYNGYVYEIGGWAAANLANVYYAKIDPAGVVSSSTWNSYTTGTSALTNLTHKAASVAYNGYLYVLGGNQAGSVSNKVYYAAINSDGSVNSWASATALPASIAYATAQAYNGYIYVLGGMVSNVSVTTVYYNTINSNGSLGATWTTNANSLVTATQECGSIAYNGYMYVLGGYGTAPGTENKLVQIAPINSTGSLGTFTASSSNDMPAVRNMNTAGIWNGRIYVVSGRGAGVVQTNVYVGLIKTDGSGDIASWSTDSSTIPTGVYQGGVVIYNGYIYSVSGSTTANTSGGTTIVQYVPINSDGTLGTWSSTTSLPIAKMYGMTVVYNGVIYEMGGQNTSGTSTKDVNYAFLNNGGPGTLGSWYSGSSYNLGTATDTATSVAYNGYVYEIGGYTTGYTANVYYAAINNDGSLGSWTATSTLPTATRLASAAAYNGYIYMIGGHTGSATAFVTYAAINANGSLGAWYTGGTLYNLPTATFAATAVAYNGYLYEIGGYTTTYSSTVYYAPINANGSLGSWSTTTALPTATDASTSVAYGGYVYEIGGYTGSATANVYSAPMNSNGTLGSWTQVTSLPVATYNSTSVAYNGYLYEIGGYTTTYTATVYYAPITSGGGLGIWTSTTDLPAATDYATSVVYNGFIYKIGGYNGSVSANVTYAPISVMPRVGAYSKSFNFGSGIVPVSITYNGTLPNGANAISYELAGNNAVYGSSQSAASLPGGTANQCGSGPPSNTPYMFVSITLDDSQSGTFPDVSGNNANITDFTINYNAGNHPPPNIRLRTGQTLQQSTGLSPFDTCYP